MEDRETAIKALEDSAKEHSALHLKTMTIRQYCTYYRIANEAYEAYYRKRSIGNRLYEEQPNIPEELRDVVYYKRVKFVDVDKLYDIDSPEDFIRFATPSSKTVSNEKDMPMIGYGAMVVESLLGIVALVVGPLWRVGVFALEHHCIEGATAGLDDSCF